MLTGDTLFVGDVGRPDLRAALGWSAARSGRTAVLVAARQAVAAAGFEPRLPGPRRRLSVRQGDQQGNGLDDRRAAAIELRAAADEREAFIELVTADQPDAPPYFTYDAVLNSRERPTLDQALARELQPLTIDELAR